MMREHMGLYRGKRTKNGEWVEGFYLEFSDPITGIHERYIQTVKPDGRLDLMHRVDPDTVGECTGLSDKNGELIFEGDICDHHVQGDILVNRGVVNWDAKNGRWAFQLNTMNPCFYMHNPDAWEIIGNIHDNPELLESEGRLWE